MTNIEDVRNCFSHEIFHHPSSIAQVVQVMSAILFLDHQHLLSFLKILRGMFNYIMVSQFSTKIKKTRGKSKLLNKFAAFLISPRRCCFIAKLMAKSQHVALAIHKHKMAKTKPDVFKETAKQSQFHIWDFPCDFQGLINTTQNRTCYMC